MAVKYTIENSGLADRIYSGYECIAETVNTPMCQKLIDTANMVVELQEALTDLLDGGNHNWYEIQRNTGLSEARCKQIEEIFKRLL